MKTLLALTLVATGLALSACTTVHEAPPRTTTTTTEESVVRPVAGTTTTAVSTGAVVY